MKQRLMRNGSKEGRRLGYDQNFAKDGKQDQDEQDVFIGD